MSGTKNLKPLVIDTNLAQSAGSEYEWTKLQNAETFIREIKTPDVNLESSDELNRLISGIPTPLARAVMFRYALATKVPAGQAHGLLAFYENLRSEWKGLVACLALDSQPISVERVKLSYSDGKQIAQTRNLYEPAGALGNMLLEDRDLWCDQVEVLDANRSPVPFVYVLRHDGKLIGGTSPEGLLFTAPTYRVQSSRGFVNQQTGRFTDPLRATLSREETEKLWAYVYHLTQTIDAYKDQFAPKRKPDLTRIATFLQEWADEIWAYGAQREYAIDRKAIVPNLDKFGAPFDLLFNFQTTLYGCNGLISSDQASFSTVEGAVPVRVELAELLLDPAEATVAEILLDDPEDAKVLGVHLLRVTEPRERFFALPLSEKGLEIFQDNIGDLLRAGGDIKSYLYGSYDASARTIKVTFEVDVDGNVTSIEKTYRDPARIEGRVICWPDFVSKIWNKYYLYSELPHNAPEFRAFPLRADRDNFRLRFEDVDGQRRLKRIAANGQRLDKNDTAELIVDHDINKIGTTDLKYEIYESQDPFKGVELQHKSRKAGYVLFRSLTEGNAYTLKDYRGRLYALRPVRVGFDFGSNNICISYKGESDASAKLTIFKNRRRCLLGRELPDDQRLAASPNEVFFFQNEQTRSNLVKSMVMIHDERRIRSAEGDVVIEVEKAVKGGFPVFEKNIPVEEGTESTLKVRFLNQPAEIKFNMKWSHDKKENAYKKGLLRGLWLKTYAELLEEERHPSELVWAYPSAMTSQTQLDYSRLWHGVGELNPLLGDQYNKVRVARLDDVDSRGAGRFQRRSGSSGGTPDSERIVPQTEALSVCKYALDSQRFNVQRSSLFIGFDVGGSTTDMLCMVQRKKLTPDGVESWPETLVKEGSIRFAAGKIADATRKSPKFQEVLKTFCKKRGMHIHGVTIPPERLNSSTASYYYNIVVDSLNKEEHLQELYRDLAADCPELFALNTYMTGLIMFYAGQLAALVRRVQDEYPADYQMPFDEVAIGCFGKGGRMFDWLPAMNEGAARGYFEDCFASGYGPRTSDHIKYFNFEPSNPAEVKAEVSFGLASRRGVDQGGTQIHELVGELGYTFNGSPVDEYSEAAPRLLEHIGSQLWVPREFPRFAEFAKIFQAFTKEYFNMPLPSMEDDIRGMKLTPYVQNLPDFQLAKRATEFDFEAPLIILEGMCFLDTVLMPKLFR